MSSQPIADLSYRTYDGPKSIGRYRWWPIVKSGIRVNLRKKFFWVLVGFACIPYAFLMLTLFLQSSAPSDWFMNTTYPALLAGTFSNWFFSLFIALFVGAGSIAADNRSNALQVYLAKPITKRDYLIGKWLTIFLLVFSVTFAPMFVTTLYAAFSEGIDKFISSYPALFFVIFLLSALPAAIHASMLVGVSAWSKTPWIAGLIYVGIIVFSNTSCEIFRAISAGQVSRRVDRTIEQMNPMDSISALGASILNVEPRSIGQFRRRRLPYWEPILGLYLFSCIAGIAFASVRIRAVEVIEG